MSYTKTIWQDLPDTSTPATATRLNNMETGIADANGALAVANYSDSDTYEVGDYVIYDNKLYKCNIAISTAEAFNSTKWQQIKIAEEINNTGVTVSPTEPTGNNKNKIWFKRGKNLFNAYEYSFSTRDTNEVCQINNSNKLTVSGTNKSWTRAKTIISDLKPNTTYSMAATITNSSQHNAAIIVSIGTSENRASSSVESIRLRLNFTTDSTGTIEVLFMSNWSSTNLTETVIFDNIQLEVGSTATDYETYVEPKIYTKNSNNVYEEFIMPENKVYSTGEVRIGTWISGEPLYRKVIQTTTPTCSTNGTSAWQQVVIQNVKFGMIKECQMVSNTTNGTLVVPVIRNTLAAGLNQFISASFVNNTSNNTGVFQIENSSTTFNNRTVYAVIEYTKVAD